MPTLREAVEARLANPPAEPKKPVELDPYKPLEEQTFVVGYKDTKEFLESVTGTGWDTVTWHYTWTTDRSAVMRLNWKDLVASGLMLNLTVGYGGGVFMKRVK